MARKPSGRKHAKLKGKHAAKTSASGGSLRVIGGQMRGRPLEYSGDPRTRPMKDRIREALFNLLGPSVKGKHAIDLFAGTGALGIEAISRGAVKATMIERHFPTARLMEKTSENLQISDRVEIVVADTFYWLRKQANWSGLADIPWVVFCSPPYDFYVDRLDEMRSMLRTLHDHAPPRSLIAVESDDRFNFDLLGSHGTWNVRRYAPAVVGILKIDDPKADSGDSTQVIN